MPADRNDTPPTASKGVAEPAVAPIVPPRPEGASAVLALSDGTILWGDGLGAAGEAVGELCFNTSMTGYQEVLTDPSYAGQLITFTFPHIGNVGANPEDMEGTTPFARGAVFRARVSEPSNWRASQHLSAWLRNSGLVAISGLDTRSLTRRIRALEAPSAVIAHDPEGRFDLEALVSKAAGWPGLAGMDLAAEVSCRQSYLWDETRWQSGSGFGRLEEPEFHVVAVDYGAKRNILRCLASEGCRVTVVPASADAETILAHRPDGIFLANGPGDPAATGIYAVPTIRRLIESDLPIFGICLGHQLLARALGAETVKMAQGHRGANHPVKDLATGRVEITSQNHGFVVREETLPEGVVATHRSLFDGTNEGLAVEDRPVFSVQYHPEASPGPEDSHYLFGRFIDLIRARREGRPAVLPKTAST